MTNRTVRSLVAAAAVAVALVVILQTSSQAEAAGLLRVRQAGDMFQNYTAGGGCACNTAAMYVAPRPAPPVVGHTYYTYPPLAPHEFMYRHSRTYIRLHRNSPATRTHVLWW